jgi:hypothetical protein
VEAEVEMVNLSRLPVVLEGKWVRKSELRWPYSSAMVWRGVLRAEQPITALALIELEGLVSWSRALRPRPNDPEFLTKALPCELIVRPSFLGWHVFQGLAGMPLEPQLLDKIRFTPEGLAGETFWPISVGGALRARVGVFALALGDTLSKRNRLWKLRAGRLTQSVEFTVALNFQRQGVLDLAYHNAFNDYTIMNFFHGLYLSTGVNTDYAEAANWFRSAAEQGYPRAQYELGQLYEKGLGVIQDYVQAHTWMTLALEGIPASERDRHNQATSSLDRVAAVMTPEQVAEAQKLAREWKPKSN